MTSVEKRFLTGFRSEDADTPGLVQEDDGTVWLIAPDGTRTQISSGGPSSAVISSTDPGAIGAGALWIRTDPGESYAPTLQVRNATNDGWVDDSNVGFLLGLTYYDEDGNVATCIYGGPTFAQIKTADGQLDVGASSSLSATTLAFLRGGSGYVEVDGVNHQIILKPGGSSLAPFYATQSDVNVNFVLLVGTDGANPLPADKGAIIIGPSNEVSDANLSPGWCGISYDDTNGAAKVKFKAKTADGTVVHAEIALT